MTDEKTNEGLAEFIRKSPSMFHTTAQIRERLDSAGFTYLPEGAGWDVAPGGSYYTVRNNSSVVAWRVGESALADGAGSHHFQIVAAHGDSPTYKVKAASELAGPGDYLRLDVEAYGGMIDHTWLDRPLGVAGRVLVREGSRVASRLVAPDRDLLLIPSVAVHLDRESGLAPKLDRACDLMPLFALRKGDASGALDALLAEELGVEPGQIMGRDVFLVCREEPRVWGAGREFFSAPKLDDLQSAYAALEAFVGTRNSACVSVFACFDNEEVGSNTKQGALSTLLADTLARTSAALGASREQHLRALAGSFLVSADNAHAVHPNRPQKHDEANRCWLNGGLVIKEAANQHYCTDGFSRAVLTAVLDDAGVPHQTFANRSDMAGGGTLGNLSNMQVSLHGVDVGLPQLAMHSCFETTGAADTALGIRALSAFYAAGLRIDGADSALVG